MFFSKKILILLALLLLTTGCCRILMEVEAFNDPNGGYNPAQEPPDRFLCGTRAALAFPPTIPEAPLELVADIVCLPIDFVLLAYYLADPPLASLVEHNQLNRLERALKNGADPNKIDRRFGPYTPLWQARTSHNAKAFQLLLENGAQLPSESQSLGLLRPGGYDKADREITLLALRHGLPETWAKDRTQEFTVNDWVSCWIKACNALEPNLQKQQMLFEIIELLLKHKFPVNSLYRRSDSENQTMKTALDRVLLNWYLSPENKNKMASLLRAHGAKTYLELVAEDPSLPHLDLKGINVPPQFQSVIDVLKNSVDAAGYRISDKHPTIAGPILVIDYLPAKVKNKKPYFETIQVHRRKSPTEWNQELEPLEIPASCRIILTDKGKKLSSQLSDDLPKQMVIREQWFSLPTCEMYIMLNSFNREDLVKIIQPLYPPSMKFSQIDSKISSFFPQLEELIVFNRFLTEKLEPLCIEKWPNAANVLKRIQDKTAEMQLKGEWTLHSFNEPLYYKGAIMVFSTCRSLDELKKCPRPIAPFPEELVIVIFITDFSEEHLKHEWPDKERMYIGPFLEYWHYAGYSIKGLKDVRVFYGDDVTHETLEKIPPIIKTLFPPCDLPEQP
jgi:hypothetical protein